jgi:hypothetical protein
LLHLGELALDLGEDELREGAALLVDADVDTPIFGDDGIRAQAIDVAQLAGQLRVCGGRVVRVRRLVGRVLVGAMVEA